MKKIILLLCLLTLGVKSQNKDPVKEDTDVPIEFNVLLDGKKVESDSICIGFVSKNSVKIQALINDSFTTYFKPNKLYHIIVTRHGYNKQIITLNTDSLNHKIRPVIDVYLSSTDKDCYLGMYKYNQLLNKYINYTQ